MKLFFMFTLISLSQITQASIFTLEFGPLVSFSSSKISETNSTSKIEHDSFLDPGVGLEGRFSFDFPMLSVGMVGDYTKESSRVKYSPVNQSVIATQSYSNTRERVMYGPTAIVHLFSSFRVVTEYFFKARDKYTYSDNKDINPFHQGDYVYGTGYGIGVGFQALKSFAHLIFRQLNFDKEAGMRDVVVDLPSNRFSRFKSSGLYLTFGISL